MREVMMDKVLTIHERDHDGLNKVFTIHERGHNGLKKYSPSLREDIMNMLQNSSSVVRS